MARIGGIPVAAEHWRQTGHLQGTFLLTFGLDYGATRDLNASLCLCGSLHIEGPQSECD